MEYEGTYLFKGPLISVRALVTEGKSYTYLYRQVMKLEDNFRFDLFLSFSPILSFKTVGRIGNLEILIEFLIELSYKLTY